jgi:hypothetical protein
MSVKSWRNWSRKYVVFRSVTQPGPPSSAIPSHGAISCDNGARS